MDIRFDDRVAIVTGAGNGLGRSHALALAARGAKVVVNDLGAALGGGGQSVSAAETVVAEIEAAGGQAIANGANVSDEEQVEAMVASACEKWGRVDILVNNAGILRDKSFAKMTVADFKSVVDVHLFGAVNCSKAVWNIMREQNYGRIVMTSSSSGLYGNFGQANYGAAKMALVGLMNTLHLEGAKYNVHVNALSPIAATRMTADVTPPDILALLTLECVTAGLLYLVDENAPSRLVLCAGAGGYAATRIYETEGIYLPEGAQTPENISKNIEKILDISDQNMLQSGGEQTLKFAKKAADALNIALNDI